MEQSFQQGFNFSTLYTNVENECGKNDIITMVWSIETSDNK